MISILRKRKRSAQIFPSFFSHIILFETEIYIKLQSSSLFIYDVYSTINFLLKIVALSFITSNK